MLKSTAWASWCALVDVLGQGLQHEWEVKHLHAFDDLILKHSEAFDLVKEYSGMKRPKHHFLTHMPTDVWMYGPPRGYWCFGFETFNQVIKRGVNRSNFKSPEVSCIRWYWRRSTHRMRSGAVL